MKYIFLLAPHKPPNHSLNPNFKIPGSSKSKSENGMSNRYSLLIGQVRGPPYWSNFNSQYFISQISKSKYDTKRDIALVNFTIGKNKLTPGYKNWI